MNKDTTVANKKKKKFNYFFYDFVKVTGIIPASLWLHPKVYHVGDKKKHNVKGPLLITSNHIGFRDPVFILCVLWQRRIFGLVTKDVFDKKFMGWMLRKIHCIEVDKKNFSMQSFHMVSDLLSDGRAVLVFPEGEVNRQENSMLSFKTGAVLMAHKNKALVLPVYIDLGEKWYHRNIAVIGDPIDVCEICGKFPSMEALNRASEHIQNKELELKAYFENEIKNKN